MSITVLGCSGTYAGPGGACSGYLVRSGTTTLWVDCGPGTLANLQGHVELGDLDAILVSHSHPDHFTELPVAYNALKWYLGVTGLPVYSTAEVRRLTDEVTGWPDGESSDATGATDDVFDWHMLSVAEPVRIGDITVSCSVTDHPVETMAMRFDHEAGSIVYTADTGPAWDPVPLAAGADVMVCDATMLERLRADGVPHLSAAGAARMAVACDVETLVVTHAAPGSDTDAHVDEATSVVDGMNVIGAHVGLVVEVSPDV